MTTSYKLLCVLMPAMILEACGSDSVNSRSSSPSAQRELDSADVAAVNLKKFPSETVVESVVFAISQREATALTAQSWTVELEQKKDVTSHVAAKKYLKVSGSLIPKQGDGAAEIGCLQIELRDNVNYREQGWLRIATNGIAGEQFTEVLAPIFIAQNGWTQLPILNDSVTLGNFSENTVKSFDGSVCFKIDMTGLPSQSYKGQVIVQYLKSSAPHDEVAPPLDAFACSVGPTAINRGETAALKWKLPPSIQQLTFRIRTDPQMTDQGRLSAATSTSVVYSAPTNPASSFKAFIEAVPDNDDYLPAFCEVHVIAKDDIGIGDDGEINGLTGNVYKLEANTNRLPDFSKLTPVSHIVAANIDIPERAFSAGFPGVAKLIEWFGVQFRATIRVATACSPCKFKLVSDDGSILYINNNKIVDNDGLHYTASREGSMNLAAGEHQLRLDYFQGPRYHITLQLYWDRNDGRGYQIIASDAFSRPLQ
jgi:hypothetical protein